MVDYPSTCFYSATWACNMKCPSCAVYSDYSKHNDYRTLDEVKSDLEPWFKKVRWGHFVLLGGEHFTYPFFEELVYYVFKNTDVIHARHVMTNGLMLMSIPDSYIQACKKTGTVIHVVRKPKPAIENQLALYDENLITAGIERVRKMDAVILDKRRRVWALTPKRENGKPILRNSDIDAAFKFCVPCRYDGMLYRGKFYRCLQLAVWQHGLDKKILDDDYKLEYTPVDPDSPTWEEDMKPLKSPISDCAKCRTQLKM